MHLVSHAANTGSWSRSSTCRWRFGSSAKEAFAAPNWNRFVDDSSTPDDEYEVVCADRRFLDLYLTAMRRGGLIDETTLVHDELTPWQATYWKQLPRAHRAQFKYQAFDRQWMAAPEDLRRGWLQWR